ncbi:MAG TPA: hypothetical protein DCR93_19265, partial [Cytophagales bacterium]|nr:hypothetical protein [Cytophagales bacterium]
VTAVLDFFDAPENASKYRILPNEYILFGHSTGGGLALLSGAEDPRVKRIGMYSPWNVSTTSEENFEWLQGYLKGLFMLNMDAKAFVDELRQNLEAYDPLRHQEVLGTKQVLVVDENERNRPWVEQIEHAQYVLMDTDHSFSDKRLELIEVVSDWLDH